MSNRRVIIYLLLALAAAIGANAFFAIEGDERAKVPRKFLLPSAADESICRISILRSNAVDAVVSDRDGEWRLAAPFAGAVDGTKIMRALDALAALPVEDEVSTRELSRLGRSPADFGLAVPRLSIVLESADGHSDTVSLGSTTLSGSGVYAALDGVGAVFVVSTNVLGSVDVSISSLRRSSLFDVGPESVVAFDLKRGNDSFLRFSREDDKWMMSRPRKAVAVARKVNQLLLGMMAADALEYVWPVGLTNEATMVTGSLLAGYGLDPERAVTATFRCIDGKDRQISFGDDAGEGLAYALVQDGGAIVKVDIARKDDAAADESAFVDSRLFPYEVQQISAVTIANGDVSYILAKEANSWRMEAPVVAPASEQFVGALIDRLTRLNADAATASGDGLLVSVMTNDAPIEVRADMVLGRTRFEDLRSTEVTRIRRDDVHRVSVNTLGGAEPTSIAYDRDRRIWNVESAEKRGRVSVEALDAMFAVLDPLVASKVVCLKVDDSDLRDCGLETPFATIAVDFDRGESIRRNLLIGSRVDGGYYATLGSSDAIFLIPDETVIRLLAPLVVE